jgi:hypothetical protein
LLLRVDKAAAEIYLRRTRENGTKNMTLAFLNPCRSYDETRRAVRFIGHDGMFEIRFFVDVEAFVALDAGNWPSEAASLSAFDASVEAIHHIARKAYSRHRRDIYTLTVDDFA